MKLRNTTATMALVALCHAGAATANDAHAADLPQSGSSLSITMTPFSGWVPGVDGTVAGPKRSVDVSLSPLDIIRNVDDLVDALDGIYIGWGEIRSKQVGLFYDVYYLDVSSAETIKGGAISLGLDLAFRQTTATVAATYRLWELGNSHWDLMAGARISDIDIRIAANLNALKRERSTGATWTDAIVGAKGRYELDSRWSLAGWGLIGAGGSDVTWDLYGAVNYAVSPGFDIGVGFRGMKIDYASRDFTWDVLQYGPVLNATFKF